MHFIEKIVDFDINGVVSGIFNSNFAEIWSGDRFRDYPKNAAIFEILFFCDFKSKIVSKSTIFRLWPLKNCEKLKFQKSLRHFFVSPLNVSPYKISASSDLQIPVTSQLYVKIDNFFHLFVLPYI